MQYIITFRYSRFRSCKFRSLLKIEKKSSGHAFEEIIKDIGNLSLKQYGVEIILQRDLSLLLFETGVLKLSKILAIKRR